MEIETSNLVDSLIVASPSPGNKPLLKEAWSGLRDPFFKF